MGHIRVDAGRMFRVATKKGASGMTRDQKRRRRLYIFKYRRRIRGQGDLKQHSSDLPEALKRQHASIYVTCWVVYLKLRQKTTSKTGERQHQRASGARGSWIQNARNERGETGIWASELCAYRCCSIIRRGVSPKLAKRLRRTFSQYFIRDFLLLGL